MSLTCLDRPVVRVTRAVERGRPIVVKLEEGGKLIRLKLKGTRTWYTCSVESVFWLAVRNAMADVRKAKKKGA